MKERRRRLNALGGENRDPANPGRNDGQKEEGRDGRKAIAEEKL